MLQNHPRIVAGKMARAKVILANPDRFGPDDVAWAEALLLESRDTPVLPSPPVRTPAPPEPAPEPIVQAKIPKPPKSSKRRSKA